MFILTLTRWLAALASAAFLAGAAYLLWSWSQGQWVRDAAGQTWHVREPWRLWAAGLLFTWCALGRWVAPLLLAKGGGRATRSARSHGEVVPEATGSALYGERHGPADAPVIVFTHGWGMDSTFWDYARQDLGERFQLVLWDLRGLGRSRAPAAAISLGRFAEDLAGLLATLDRPAVLVGHSIGGMTIQTLLRDHPGSVAAARPPGRKAPAGGGHPPSHRLGAWVTLAAAARTPRPTDAFSRTRASPACGKRTVSDAPLADIRARAGSGPSLAQLRQA